MSIHFVCPLGHKLKVPDDRAGQPGRCPVCHQRLFVPQVGTDAAERAGSAAEVDFGIAAPNEAASEVRASPNLEFDGWATEQEGSAAELVAGAGMRRETETQTTPPTPPPPIPSQPGLAAIASPPPLPPAPPPTTVAPPTQAEVQRAAVRWLLWRRADLLDGYAILRPDARQLEIAYWLASLLPFAAAFCAAPALPHLEFSGAPGWAQWMLCAAVLQVTYAAWLAILPDGSTVRVGMYLFAASAAAYLAGMTATCVLSNSQLSSLGLSGLRWPAAAWCGLACVVTSLTSGACGWIARHWHS
ncbi:MAG TPA: hypothetical protein VG125_23115 [Pirellulales bacterium]|nr:hypothetical protein [Pirellulales bacterium]